MTRPLLSVVDLSLCNRTLVTVVQYRLGGHHNHGHVLRLVVVAGHLQVLGARLQHDLARNVVARGRHGERRQRRRGRAALARVERRQRGRRLRGRERASVRRRRRSRRGDRRQPRPSAQTRAPWTHARPSGWAMSRALSFCCVTTLVCGKLRRGSRLKYGFSAMSDALPAGRWYGSGLLAGGG